MSLLRRLRDSFTAALRAANAEGRVAIMVEGDQATLRDVETKDVRWTVDLRALQRVTAWVQNKRAMDYVTVRLGLPDRDVEVEDDTIGFGAFMRDLEARLGVELLEPAMALGQQAYGGAHAVLWERGNIDPHA